MESKTLANTKQQMGFTLVELMTGLVIISIISVMMLWSGNSLTRGYRIRDAVRQTVGAIQYARMQASIRNQNYRVQICTHNTNCAVRDHPNLQPFGLITPALAGFWFIEQCPTAGLVGSRNCGDLGRRQELKFYDLARAYRDVELYAVRTTPTSLQPAAGQPLTLYFRPDGRVQACTYPTPNTISCNSGTYNLCIRASRREAKTGPDAIPRRIQISFTGLVNVSADGNNTLCPAPPATP